MKNWLSIAILFAGLVLLNACAGKATQSQFGINSSALVASAQATIETLKRRDDIPEFKKMLKIAHGIMIFPTLYKAGFHNVDGVDYSEQALDLAHKLAKDSDIPDLNFFVSIF